MHTLFFLSYNLFPLLRLSSYFVHRRQWKEREQRNPLLWEERGSTLCCQSSVASCVNAFWRAVWQELGPNHRHLSVCPPRAKRSDCFQPIKVKVETLQAVDLWHLKSFESLWAAARTYKSSTLKVVLSMVDVWKKVTFLKGKHPPLDKTEMRDNSTGIGQEGYETMF